MTLFLIIIVLIAKIITTLINFNIYDFRRVYNCVNHLLPSCSLPRMNCKGILMFARLKSFLERVKRKKNKSIGFKIGRLTNQR